MPREKSAWDRYNEREEEAEKERLELVKRRGKTPSKAPGSKAAKAEAEAAAAGSIFEMMAQGELLLEQIQNLYQMFVAGMERTPPVTHVKRLDDLMKALNAAGKPTATGKFQHSQFLAKVSMYKDKWDRLKKDIESGKVVVKRKKSGGGR